MTTVSSRAFSANPIRYLNLASRESVAVRRGTRIFRITPEQRFGEKTPKREVSVESLIGCLKEYANPELWEKEKHAWEEHVIEKYGNI